MNTPLNLYDASTSKDGNHLVSVGLLEYTHHFVVGVHVMVNQQSVLESDFAVRKQGNVTNAAIERERAALIRYVVKLHRFLVNIHPEELVLEEFNDGVFHHLDTTWSQDNKIHELPFSLKGLDVVVEFIPNGLPTTATVEQDNGDTLVVFLAGSHTPTTIMRKNIVTIVEGQAEEHPLKTTVGFFVDGEGLYKARDWDAYGKIADLDPLDCIAREISDISDELNVDTERVRMRLFFGEHPECIEARYSDGGSRSGTVLGFFANGNLIDAKGWEIFASQKGGFMFGGIDRHIEKIAGKARVFKGDVEVRFYRNETVKGLLARHGGH